MHYKYFLLFICLICFIFDCYRYAVTEISLAEFGQGNGNILLSNVGCHGNETSLAECKKPAWRKHVCHAYEAAGVVCAVDKGI